MVRMPQMRTANQWLAEYAASHQNPTNQRIHLFCVPAISFAVLGLLWQLQLGGWGNGALVMAALALSFYGSLGRVPFLIGAGQILVILGLVYLVERYFPWPNTLYISIFVVAWIFQFVGHKIEGKKPSFFQDILFLLIGPLWIFKH